MQSHKTSKQKITVGLSKNRDEPAKRKTASAQPLRPFTWRHWYLASDKSQSPALFIPLPWRIPEMSVEDRTKGILFCLTPCNCDTSYQWRIHRRHFLAVVLAHRARTRSQLCRPRQHQYEKFQYKWWWRSCILVLRDQTFLLTPLQLQCYLWLCSSLSVCSWWNMWI